MTTISIPDRRTGNLARCFLAREPLLVDFPMVARLVSGMFLAYFDESGDSGLTNSPTRFFVLACAIVHQDFWLSSLDHLVRLRGELRRQFGISPRREIKAVDIRRGRGEFDGLHWSLATRMTFYRNLLTWVKTTLTEFACFAIAIDKIPCNQRGREPRETAWTYALQRLDTFCKRNNDKVMVFPDEGHGVLVKRLIRRIRRFQRIPGFFGGTALSIPTERIIEDPNDRKSHDSYFVQLADWLAYACHRSSHVHPQANVPDDLWDVVVNRHLRAVNRLTGGPPAIVYWPRP